MADIKTIDDENFAGKKVLVRVDFNAPVDADGNVTLTDGEESWTFPVKSAGYVKLCDDEDLF